jgi:hypothetical protein
MLGWNEEEEEDDDMIQVPNPRFDPGPQSELTPRVTLCLCSQALWYPTNPKSSWLSKSMNFFGNPPLTTIGFQPPHPLKPKTLSQIFFEKLDLERPSTLKLVEHKPSCEHPCHLLPPLIDNFETYSNLFAHDPSMMWCLHQVTNPC